MNALARRRISEADHARYASFHQASALDHLFKSRQNRIHAHLEAFVTTRFWQVSGVTCQQLLALGQLGEVPKTRALGADDLLSLAYCHQRPHKLKVMPALFCCTCKQLQHSSLSACFQMPSPKHMAPSVTGLGLIWSQHDCLCMDEPSQIVGACPATNKLDSSRTDSRQ